MTRKKLAVAIPSYNRATLLDDILWNLGPQVDRHSEDCELYVIDNCSTDETPAVVERHQTRWKGIRYHRNEENVGLVRNIARGLSVPNSEWVWLMGDDDIPMAYAVGTILADLATLGDADISFLLLKGAKVDADRKYCPQTWNAATAEGAPVHIFKQGVEVISVEGIHCLAWLSVLVVKRDRWDQGLFDRLYRETDLYTFVAVLLHMSAGRASAFARRLIVMATDRGSRAYYFSKTAIARLAEFPAIEKIVVKECGMARARELLANGRRGWFRERMACVLKIAVFRDEYAEQQHLLDRPVSPFPFERFCIRFVAGIARISLVRSALIAIYRRNRADRVFTRESINRSA